MSETQRFRAELRGADRGGAVFDVRIEVAAALRGAERPPVTVTVNEGWEYVQWIEEATRPETGARRIAGTIERLQAGTSDR